MPELHHAAGGGRQWPSKHQQIVAAAHKLFLEAGYGATSMDAIAQQACVSKRTVYSHFGGKEALFSDVVASLCQSHFPAILETLTAEASPADFLTEIGRHGHRVLFEGQAVALLRTVIAESAQFPELGELIWQAGMAAANEMVAGFLGEMERRGQLRITGSLELAAAQFLELVRGPLMWPLLLGIGRPPSKEEREEVLHQAVDVFLHGVARRDSVTH